MRKSTLNYSKKEVFEAIEYALNELELEIEESSFKSGRIKAHYGGSLLSFGNNIQIMVRTTKTSRTSVTIESSTWAQLQVIDWGTNDQLEERIINGTKKILGL